MKKYARIAGDMVAEIIEIPAGAAPIEKRFHPAFVAAMVEVPAASAVAPGWLWDGDGFAPPPPPAPTVPSLITRRQLLLALAAAGLITGPQALAAATIGAVPAPIDGIFAQLPAAEALAARITWASMTVVERQDPLLGALIAANLATPAQVDALFIAGAAM
jgi:hypothetical protein